MEAADRDVSKPPSLAPHNEGDPIFWKITRNGGNKQGTGGLYLVNATTMQERPAVRISLLGFHLQGNEAMKKLFALAALLGLGLYMVGCAGETKVETPSGTTVETGPGGTTVETPEGTTVETGAGGTTVETPPAEGTTPPAEGTTPPAEGTTPPAEGTTPPAEGAAPAEAPAGEAPAEKPAE
jgi:hypothetical protein